MKSRSYTLSAIAAAVICLPVVLIGCGGNGDDKPAVTPPPAADLTDCCTPGGKDFAKVGGNLGNQNYSGLAALEKKNVAQLGGAWVNRVEGGLTTGTNQSTTVVVDGVVYLETALGNVIAVDGKTGVTKWKWETPHGTITRRGVAVAKDLGLVYTVAKGNRLVALKIATGEVAWTKEYPNDTADANYLGSVQKVALVYHDKRLYIGTNDGNRGAAFTADATNGNVLNVFWGVPPTPRRWFSFHPQESGLARYALRNMRRPCGCRHSQSQ